jgi:26S proteasome regulatory subunit N3
MTDVEMKDAPVKDAEKPVSNGVPNPQEAQALLVADLQKNITQIIKSVATKESRFVARVLRQTSAIRRKLTAPVLVKTVNLAFPKTDDESAPIRERLLGSLGKDTVEDVEMVVAPTEVAKDPKETNAKDTKEAKEKEAAAAKDRAAALPEVEVYLHLLVLIFLIGQQRHDEATVAANSLIERIQSFNRVTLNLLSARAYFYYSRSYELVNKLDQIRPTLLAAFRTFTLRHNDEGQATLLNLLLRNYLAYNLYDQADKLVSKTHFPEQSTSSNQVARYLYYQGRIKAIQLEYSDAYNYLVQAIRKAPQTSAIGFRQTVHKLLCIVQLLMGEMPDRTVFAQKEFRSALRPYLRLAQAIRVGDLVAFHQVVDQFSDIFKADKTFTLIQRLRHNVIKTGLRKINVAYSRISLADVCTKLHLGAGVEDAEFIVAKAIRDGVIDATIDHAGGYMQSKESGDIYSTQEPHAAFHRRITFCLDIHNEAVKAMRFAPDAHKQSQIEVAKAHKERQQQEQELAKELEEDDDDSGF